MSAPGNGRWLRAAMALVGGALVAASGGRADACDHCRREAPPREGAARSVGRLAAQGAPAGQVKPAYVRSERRYAVPDVTLLDGDARPVRLREALAADEPVMLNFIFTTCTAICPVMSGIFARVPEALGGDAARLRRISISIDPEHDTPARLRDYARRFGAAPGWSFLTGSARDVEAVERAFDAYRGDKMNHEPLTLLRAGPDLPWIRLDGFASPAEIAREVRKVAAR